MAERVDPLFLALGCWPLAWHAGGAAAALATPAPWRWWLLAAWLLLLPPLLCRAISARWIRPGEHRVASAPARAWWWAQQMQMPFNHLGGFESALRLVPGAYQAWLRLWGGRVSLRCAVAPGVRITDRQLIDVGAGAVLGEGCVLAGHLVVRDGGWRVVLGRVVVGEDALIGARALIGPGAEVGPGEEVPATQRLAPFYRWLGGRRERGAHG